MSGKFFLDTNVLIYAIDSSDTRKHGIAVDLLAEAHSSGQGCLSYQVVQEWFNFVLRKAAVPLEPGHAAAIYRRIVEPLWRIHSSRELIDTAIDIHRRQRLSWWDSLIVSAAKQGECQRLLSEDLHDGHVIRGIRVENPFR